MTRPPPISTLFPYTTLFRSSVFSLKSRANEVAIQLGSDQRSASTSKTGHCGVGSPSRDRKSTRLNSSHVSISYAVFCLKKKNTNQIMYYTINSTLLCLV